MEYRYRSTVIRAGSISVSTTYRRSIMTSFSSSTFLHLFFSLSKKISTTRYMLGSRRPHKYVQYVLRGGCIKTYVGTRFAFRNHINSARLFPHRFALLFDYLLHYPFERYKKIASLNKGPDNKIHRSSVLSSVFFIVRRLFSFAFIVSFERN